MVHNLRLVLRLSQGRAPQPTEQSSKAYLRWTSTFYGRTNTEISVRRNVRVPASLTLTGKAFAQMQSARLSSPLPSTSSPSPSPSR